MLQHIVKRGEYLSLIAKKYNTSLKSILNLPENSSLIKKRGSPNNIFPGDILAIPKNNIESTSAKKEKTNEYILRRKDWLIPLVFPDYVIDWEGIDVPYLGHAGILIINGKSGLTKYFEYGRYNTPKGKIEKRFISDASLKENQIDIDSLKKVLGEISKISGHNGKITAALIKQEGGFDKAHNYMIKRLNENNNNTRKEYDIYSYNCMTFAKLAIEAAGVDLPESPLHIPSAYIYQIQCIYQDLNYDPVNNEVHIQQNPTLLEKIFAKNGDK